MPHAPARLTAIWCAQIADGAAAGGACGESGRPAMSMNDVPQRAQVVIVGGGAVGCSVAYHLAQLGWTDVVLLEQGQLSCGTTWHAAGIVGQLRNQPSLTQLMLYGSQLYANLEAEVGLGTGWNQSGALWVAASADRMVQIRRTADMARAQGLE